MLDWQATPGDISVDCKTLQQSFSEENPVYCTEEKEENKTPVS